MKLTSLFFKEAPKETGGFFGKGTTAFKAINPELFIKPNLKVMSLGTAVFAGCIMYIMYINATADPKKKQEARFSLDTGQITYKSKWD